MYVNIGEVIRSIREEAEPKSRLMSHFSLIETQAEGILNMRLRSLRRLEEMEIRKEHKALTAELKGLQTLLGSEKLRWKKIADEIETIRPQSRTGPPGSHPGEPSVLPDP